MFGSFVGDVLVVLGVWASNWVQLFSFFLAGLIALKIALFL